MDKKPIKKRVFRCWLTDSEDGETIHDWSAERAAEQYAELISKRTGKIESVIVKVASYDERIETFEVLAELQPVFVAVTLEPF